MSNTIDPTNARALTTQEVESLLNTPWAVRRRPDIGRYLDPTTGAIMDCHPFHSLVVIGHEAVSLYDLLSNPTLLEHTLQFRNDALRHQKQKASILATLASAEE